MSDEVVWVRTGGVGGMGFEKEAGLAVDEKSS